MSGMWANLAFAAARAMAGAQRGRREGEQARYERELAEQERARRARLDAQAEQDRVQDRAERRALQDIELAQAAVFRGRAPAPRGEVRAPSAPFGGTGPNGAASPFDATPRGSPTGLSQFATQPPVVAPGDDPDRYTQVGDFYIDRDRTPEYRKQQEQRRQLAIAEQQARAQHAMLARQFPGAVGEFVPGVDYEKMWDNLLADRRQRDAGEESRALARESLQARREASAATRAVAESTREQRASQQTLARESKLRDDFGKEPAVKLAGDALNGYNNIVTGYQEARRGNTAGHLAMVYGLANLFDPGSVVREGEAYMVQRTGGLPGQARGWLLHAQGGGTFDAATIGRIKQMADAKLREMQSGVRDTQRRYGGLSRRVGADSAFVANDPLEGVLQRGAGTPGTGGRGAPPSQRFQLEPPPRRRP